uniref:Uncharacterized protein n=1 Tax=Romanomermis culicivorax TaxID=13658 RepID=A0A915JZZ2_ROMCU
MTTTTGKPITRKQTNTTPKSTFVPQITTATPVTTTRKPTSQSSKPNSKTSNMAVQNSLTVFEFHILPVQAPAGKNRRKTNRRPTTTAKPKKTTTSKPSVPMKEEAQLAICISLKNLRLTLFPWGFNLFMPFVQRRRDQEKETKTNYYNQETTCSILQCCSSSINDAKTGCLKSIGTICPRKMFLFWNENCDPTMEANSEERCSCCVGNLHNWLQV